MSVPSEESVLRFRAMTFGVDRAHAVTVGFEMDRRPGHDSRGLLISRAFPENREHDSSVYVEFGEPQQYCMEGGIERVESAPGLFRIEFTEVGAGEMAGLRTIEIVYDAAEGRDVLDALDYIFRGFDGYTRNA
jgi:hypothetical protein